MLPKGRLFGLWKPKSGPCMLEDFGGIRKETTVPRSPKCTLGDNKKEAFMRRFSLITWKLLNYHTCAVWQIFNSSSHTILDATHPSTGIRSIQNSVFGFVQYLLHTSLSVQASLLIAQFAWPNIASWRRAINFRKHFVDLTLTSIFRAAWSPPSPVRMSVQGCAPWTPPGASKYPHQSFVSVAAAVLAHFIRPFKHVSSLLSCSCHIVTGSAFTVLQFAVQHLWIVCLCSTLTFSHYSVVRLHRTLSTCLWASTGDLVLFQYPPKWCMFGWRKIVVEGKKCCATKTIRQLTRTWWVFFVTRGPVSCDNICNGFESAGFWRGCSFPSCVGLSDCFVRGGGGRKTPDAERLLQKNACETRR